MGRMKDYVIDLEGNLSDDDGWYRDTQEHQICPICRSSWKGLYNLEDHLLTHSPDELRTAGYHYLARRRENGEV